MQNAFISYSHKDREFKKELVQQLRVAGLEVFEDEDIRTGDDWFVEIKDSMDSADVAVLLISVDFLSSKFIRNREVPYLLRLREKRGLRLFPILWSSCAWERVEWLSRLQIFKPEDVALDTLSHPRRRSELKRCVSEIASILETEAQQSTLIRRASAPGFLEATKLFGARNREEMVLAYREASKEGFCRSAESFLSFELALYRREFRLSFGNEYYNIWNHSVAKITREYGDSQFSDRPVVQLFPYRVPDFIDWKDAVEEWAAVKCVLHSVLCAGKGVLVRIGELPAELRNVGEYAVIRRGMLAETRGIHRDLFATRCVLGDVQEVKDRFDLLNTVVAEVVTSPDTRPHSVFLLCYTSDVFRQGTQLKGTHAKDVHTFLWELQGGFCARCNPLVHVDFAQSELARIVPINDSGNLSLLNLEVICKHHQRDNVPFPEYRRTLVEDIGLPVRIVDQIGSAFSPTLYTDRFPFVVTYDPKLAGPSPRDLSRCQQVSR